jgi:competence protein ComFB
MAKARKSFDKELMYKKIMPTNLKKNNEKDSDGVEGDSNNDEIYKEGLVSINANRVYINEVSKSEDEDSIDSNDIKIIKQDEKIIQNFDNSESEIIADDEVCEEVKDGIIIYNVMESLVMEKLDITLQKMNCCKCDRCRDDIVALALNGLKPMYIVATKEEIENKKQEFNKFGLEVTTAVLKAVLSVRRNPRH